MESFQNEPLSSEKQFKPMDQVFVKRNSGAIEWGWKVFGYDENGEVVVRKMEKNGEGSEKHIPESELKLTQELMTEKVRRATGV